MKKIIQIIDTAYLGGAERSTSLMSQEFKKRGYKVYLVHPPGPFSKFYNELKDDGIVIIELPLRKNFIKSFFKLKKLIKEEGISYIHSHQMKADLISVLIKIFSKNIFVISSVHCVIKHDIKNPMKRLMYRISSLFSYWMVNYVFTVSNAVRDIIKSYYYLPSGKVVTTLNGITFNKITTNKKNQSKILKDFNLNAGMKLISCAGELSTRKGQKYLVESIAFIKNIDDVKIVFLGEGDFKDELSALVNRLNLKDKVLFPGFRSDVYDWMELSTIYIQPSEFDPLPRALIEAMYLGIPSISSDMDTVKDIIKDGENALLTSLEPKDIAAKIDYYLEDKNRRNYIGSNGKDFVMKNCSIANMVDIIENYLI